MARKSTKKVSKALLGFVGFVSFVVGFVVAFAGLTYMGRPDSFEIPKACSAGVASAVAGDIDVEVVKQEAMSIHFIELGNMYTGDCTLIKVGDVEILVDAGSKSDSVGAISAYINQYITDNTLEYVIVTHAHQDHYAGFATSASTESLLDMYDVENVITFARTNQKETSTLYKNFRREVSELEARMQRKGKVANVMTALECINGDITKNAKREYVLNASGTITLEVLYQGYYEAKASTENDYSVCFQINNNGKYFFFTGDLEAGGEKSLVESGLNAGYLHPVELYKAGHHGSKTSSSKDLLDVIQPKSVCVCCCAGSPEYTKTNANQFPTQDFVNRVAEWTDAVYVTTLCLDYANNMYESFNGNIVYGVDGLGDATLYFSKSDVKLKDSDWFAENRTMPTAWTS